MRRPLPLVVIAALAAVGVVAGAGPALGQSTPTTDDALVAQSVVVAADLPTGWTASPHDATGEDETLKAAQATPGCGGYAAFEAANDAVPSAQSDDFTGDGNGIHSAAYAYPTAAAAKQAMASLRPQRKVARCLRRLLDASLQAQYQDQDDVTAVRSVVRPVAQALALPDSDATGFAGGYSVQSKGGTDANRSFAIVAVRIGRVINTYTADADPDSAAVVDAFQGAVDASLRRSQAAQSGSG